MEFQSQADLDHKTASQTTCLREGRKIQRRKEEGEGREERKGEIERGREGKEGRSMGVGRKKEERSNKGEKKRRKGKDLKVSSQQQLISE